MKHNLMAAKYAARRLGTVMAVGFFLIAGWVLITTLGPIIETKWFPVYQGVVASNYQTLGSSTLLVRIDFAKARPCRLEGLAWYRLDSSGPPVLLAEQTREAEPTFVRVQADRDHVDFVGLAYHACGLMWPSRTVLGPIRVKISN